MKGTIAGVTAALVLAGCGEASSNAGAGIESSEGGSVTQSDSITQSRELSQSKTNSVTVERPLLPIMTRVIAENDLGKLMASYVCLVWNLEPGQRVQGLENLKTMIGNTLTADQIAPGSPVARTLALEPDDVLTACASSMLADTFVPLNGWPMDVHPLRASQDEVNYWMSGLLAQGVATAHFLSIVAEELVTDASLRTMEDYENATRVAWLGLTAEFSDMYFKEKSSSDRRFNVNLSGNSPYPVDFSSGSYHVGIDQSGMTLTESGVALINPAGVLNGQRYVATVENSSGSSMTRGSNSNSESATSVNESGSGRARVQ